MTAKKFLFYLLAALLGGCIPVISLHPLYNDQDLVFEEKLLGAWVDDPNSPEVTWHFSRHMESEKAYELIFCDKEGNKGLFIAHLVKLHDKPFLDVYPGELPWEPQDPNKVQWPYNAYFLVPAHTFIKIDFLGSLLSLQNQPQAGQDLDTDTLPKVSKHYDYALKMRLTDDDAFEKLIEQDPNAVKHESLKDRGIVLTASTKELQKFVLKYADDNKLFAEQKLLIRKKDRSFQQPTEQDPNRPNSSDPNKAG